MYSNKLYTPLRYPGGKARFAPFIASVMRENGLTTGHYLEPYAGGAGVALELLFHGEASHIHINDFDPAVYDFWSAVTREPEELLRLLADTPVTMEQWLHWRSVLRGQIEVGLAARGFATLFMNRTNRSGVLKGGVIGGLGQSGDYKLDARLKKDVLSKRIEMIALHSSSISVYNEDAHALLARCQTFLPPKALVYLDPPYYVKGQGLYRNFYEHGDHMQIADLLQSARFKTPWVVSYDNVAEIRQMYRMSQSLAYGLNYTAQVRYVGSEVMFFRPNLNIPTEEIPQARIAA
ncbi:DNA adenine methylase [Variovorax sp. DAIF25]|uniref:DNA adenine methylase n=1 Tax=Variovorax sp. DAIF25 TaxID=3080983 RepID=UPI003D6B556E